ncbi:hypothetical protein vseg_008241 [Gypsophila vaccaria]
MVLIERVGSISSSSSSRKTGKRQSLSSDNENGEVAKAKTVKRASSFCSPKKEKQTADNVHEKMKSSSSKQIKKASSFSSLPSPVRRERVVRQGSSLSTSKMGSPRKVLRKSSVQQRERVAAETRKKSVFMSKIKELGPICKKRKEDMKKIMLDEELKLLFDREIDEGAMINPDDCFWLSSGNMSPHEFGLFVNALDPCLDEWVISFVPNLSDKAEASDSCAVLAPGGDGEEEVVHENVDDNVGAVIDSSSSSASTSLALSTHTDNSAFWNMDRTGVWVSLINLEGEDSRLISEAISEDDSLDSNFPSPTYESNNWDSCSSDNLGVCSSARSTTHESSHSDWSSDLLSDSLDWDVDSEDPLFWPFGLSSGWDSNLDSFSVSPRKGTYEKSKESDVDGIVVSPGSIKFRLQGRKDGSKDGFKKKILFVSGLSASKIIEFKKGCRKNLATSRGSRHRRSQTTKRDGRFGKRVPPILETDLEGISPKETPTNKTQDLVEFNTSDMLSGSEDWGDEMDDSDSPLVWPSDPKIDWNVTCDFLNNSPRKNNVVSFTNLGSPKGGFTVSSSVRLKFCTNKKAKNKHGLTLSSLGAASKSFKFKPGSSYKTVSTSRTRVKSTPLPLRLSPSCKSLVVLIPPKKTSLFKLVGFSNGTTRTSTSHGKRVRAMPLKIGKSVEEFIRMASVGSVNRRLSAGQLTSGEVPIETVMGLNEFDGHEGVDMDFEEASFSFEECMRD